VGDRLVRRGPGRPLGSHKTATTIRLDDDVLDAFKATGRGWQTRVNAVLKEWLKTHKPA
ncbi:BrnA antitoxin family protein, partial [Burkholderia pseudomallei]|nr:BrnA antitoxin family protein [Burkholderia pseudomallei]MBF3912704.1 BrnA antitoxin family protein [Burkholderia pseudomallei]